MTNNTQFKTLLNTWLNQKKSMISASTYASFTLIAENHLIPYFGKRRISSITESDIQEYIMYLFEKGRLDDTGGLTVKTIRDVVLVLRLALTYGYVEKAIPMLNWDLIEYLTITSLIGGMQLFDVPATLSNGNGDPRKAVLTTSMYLYNQGFKNHNYGYAAAISTGLFVIIGILSIFSFKAMKKKGEEVS